MTRKNVEHHLDKFGMWNRKGNLRAAAIELEAAMRALLDLVEPKSTKPAPSNSVPVNASSDMPVISGAMHIDLTKIAAENKEVPVKRSRSRKAKDASGTATPKRRSRAKKEV